LSEFGDIEAGVVGLLAALEDSGAPLFATVRGSALVERKARSEALARVAAPAALVTIAGRERAYPDDVLPAAVRVVVALCDRNLRTADAPRLGDAESPGVFRLAERATAALSGAIIASTWQLSAREERVVEADERHVVIEQVWLATQL